MRSAIIVLLVILAAGTCAQTRRDTTRVSGREKARQVRALLNAAKSSLVREGKYECCIEEPCDRCALDHQNCDCAADVKEGRPICSDCYAGWQRGEGKVPGVNSSQVRMSAHSHMH